MSWPLFIGCVSILAWSFTEGFDHSRIWHYASPAITNGLLPVMGCFLAVTCASGKGLPKAFRIAALIVAVASVFGGLLAPQLAE